MYETFELIETLCVWSNFVFFCQNCIQDMWIEWSNLIEGRICHSSQFYICHPHKRQHIKIIKMIICDFVALLYSCSPTPHKTLFATEPCLILGWPNGEPPKPRSNHAKREIKKWTGKNMWRNLPSELSKYWVCISVSVSSAKFLSLLLVGFWWTRENAKQMMRKRENMTRNGKVIDGDGVSEQIPIKFAKFTVILLKRTKYMLYILGTFVAVAVCIGFGVHMILKGFQRRSMNTLRARYLRDGTRRFIICLLICVHGSFSLFFSLSPVCVFVCKCMFGVGSLKMNQLCGRPENKHWKRQRLTHFKRIYAYVQQDRNNAIYNFASYIQPGKHELKQTYSLSFSQYTNTRTHKNTAHTHRANTHA